MPKETNNSALHFFLYLLLFFSLTFVAFGTGAIMFQYINKFFPESLLYVFQGSFEQSAVKFGIAALFVAGPIFFFSSYFIGKYLFEGKIAEDSKVRRWLTYIVLFFAAGAIIGDLIALVVNFLEGDIAVKFLLKVLVVLAIAGSIFEYYFWDMRRSNIAGKRFKQDKVAFGASLGVVVVVFLAGFFIIDNPGVSREKKMDLQIVQDLQNTDSSIMNYYSDTGKLPESLEQLKNTKFFPFESREGSVSYKKITDNTFQLCSKFNHSNIEEKDRYYSDPYSNQWLHGKGEVCFERIAIQRNEEKGLPLKQ